MAENKFQNLSKENTEMTNDQVFENNEFPESENESSKSTLIDGLLEEAKRRKEILKLNQSLQKKLASQFVKDNSQSKEVAAADDSETSLQRIIDKIDETEVEMRQMQQKSMEETNALKDKIQRKTEELQSDTEKLKELKQNTAMKAVNSENGEKYSKEEVKELIKKEENLRKHLDHLQLKSLKWKAMLLAISERSTGVAEGKVDLGEYETMCISTENNVEAIKELKKTIKNMQARATTAVNVLSHLEQKVYSSRLRISKFAEKEKSVEDELDQVRNAMFEEKAKHTKVLKTNKALQHRYVLLQHPLLLEDCLTIRAENNKLKNEINKLKDIYASCTEILSDNKM